MSVYLDYNATTPIDPRVLEVMIDVYKNHPGNADSRTHDYGEDTRKIVEKARQQVAQLLGVNSMDVFFTSGATESNNIAIQGLQKYAESTGKKHIITSAIEHKAVLNTVRYLETKGYRVDYIQPDISGRISKEKVFDLIKEDTLLVSIMHVNNETGIIQPVKEIGDMLADKDILFHVDATQSCGKMVEEIRSLKYDMLSLSAHKFNGPQGIGALILRRKNYKLPPIQAITFGGQQEYGIRPGTTPVALVAGLGKACEIASLEYDKHNQEAKDIKRQIIQLLDEADIKYIINGDQNFCVSNTISVSFEGVSSEALMISTKQYCALSNGSACTSKSYEPSYVLVAMGIPEEQIESTVRISWGSGSDIKDSINNFSDLLRTVKMLEF